MAQEIKRIVTGIFHLYPILHFSPSNLNLPSRCNHTLTLPHSAILVLMSPVLVQKL